MTSRDNAAKSNFVIDYKGMLNSIPDSEIKNLMVPEDGHVGDDLAAKLDRIAGSNIDPDFVLAGKAGSLIVRCTASDAERIYDTVFGTGTVVRYAPKTAQEYNQATLRMTFGDAISGSSRLFAVGEQFKQQFGNAVRMVANDASFALSVQGPAAKAA